MWFRIGYGILRNRLPSLIKAEREESNRYSVHVRFRGIARAILAGCVTRVLEKTRKNLTDKSRIRSNFAFIQSFRFHASIPRRLGSINCNGLLVIGISGRNLESRQRYSVSSSSLLFSFFFFFFLSFPGWAGFQLIPSRVTARVLRLRGVFPRGEACATETGRPAFIYRGRGPRLRPVN